MAETSLDPSLNVAAGCVSVPTLTCIIGNKLLYINVSTDSSIRLSAIISSLTASNGGVPIVNPGRLLYVKWRIILGLNVLYLVYDIFCLYLLTDPSSFNFLSIDSVGILNKAANGSISSSPTLIDSPVDLSKSLYINTYALWNIIRLYANSSTNPSKDLPDT